MTKHAFIGLLCLAAAGCSLMDSFRGKENTTDDNRPSERSALETNACSTSAVKKLIGQIITLQMAEEARLQARANQVRILGPEDPLTMDYDSTRLNVEVDRNGKIMRVSCG